MIHTESILIYFVTDDSARPQSVSIPRFEYTPFVQLVVTFVPDTQTCNSVEVIGGGRGDGRGLRRCRRSRSGSVLVMVAKVPALILVSL